MDSANETVTMEAPPGREQQAAGAGILLQISMLVLAFVLGHVLRRKKIYCLPEASASLIIGAINDLFTFDFVLCIDLVCILRIRIFSIVYKIRGHQSTPNGIGTLKPGILLHERSQQSEERTLIFFSRFIEHASTIITLGYKYDVKDIHNLRRAFVFYEFCFSTFEEFTNLGTQFTYFYMDGCQKFIFISVLLQACGKQMFNYLY